MDPDKLSILLDTIKMLFVAIDQSNLPFEGNKFLLGISKLKTAALDVAKQKGIAAFAFDMVVGITINGTTFYDVKKHVFCKC